MTGKVSKVEVEEYMGPRFGWERRTRPASTEHEARKLANKLKRRRDIRFVRLVVDYPAKDGRPAYTTRLTLKSRFPKGERSAILQIQSEDSGEGASS